MSRLLFISNLYPNSREPNRSTFNRQQISALSNYFEIDVIAPISWIQHRGRVISTQADGKNIRVFNPFYFYTPRVLRQYYGMFYYLSISGVARRLLGERSYSAILSSWLYPDGWAAARLAKEWSLPLFLKVHGTDVNSLAPLGVVTRAALDTVSQAKYVICVSDALKKRLLTLGTEEEKLFVLRNGVDKNIFHTMDRLTVRKELKISVDERVILYVGNLKREKGLDELASAMEIICRNKQLGNVRLVVIGEGEYREKFYNRLVSSGTSDRAIFPGSRPLQEVARWMNAADVLCLPSYSEGLPNVVLEAISCGTRVVATNVGGIPELETEGRLLVLIPPHDADALAFALEKILNSASENEVEREYINRNKILTWEENAGVLAEMIGGRKSFDYVQHG
jgi:teichuronic acid biosynthesis glycosyltransferase TuaC